MVNDADVYSEELVYRAHPHRVAAGEVVVYGDEVRAESRKPVKVQREGCHECFTLTRFHFGDSAHVEHEAAYELDVEGAHAERPSRRLAREGERLGHDLKKLVFESFECRLVGRLAAAVECAPDPFLKTLRLCLKIPVGKLPVIVFVLGDRVEKAGEPSYFPVVLGAYYFLHYV